MDMRDIIEVAEFIKSNVSEDDLPDFISDMDKDVALLGGDFEEDVLRSFVIAKVKHPLYAEGKYQALGVVQSEIAEFLKAIERGTDEEAVAEAKDAIVTLQRFVLGHHLPEDQRGYGWEKRISE